MRGEEDMSQLHIYIDGSWLYKSGGPGRVLSSQTENPNQGVRIDFSRFDELLLRYVQQKNPQCIALGERYIVTSLFTLPPDFDSWSDEYSTILPDHLEQTKRGITAREHFVNAALSAGYSDKAIYRPIIRSWIVEKLIQKQYHEKQVDATVVALLVRSAIIYSKDFHCVVTGDADILPAIKVAYPEYTENVFIATTHPDELKAEHRQAAFSLNNFEFKIPPVYLQDYVKDFIQGDQVYSCANCKKVFVRLKPIPSSSRPYCSVCLPKRT
ncbi:MAG: hypothetical protein WC329_02215 [Candidatus Omnitrophota bacterium]